MEDSQKATGQKVGDYDFYDPAKHTGPKAPGYGYRDANFASLDDARGYNRIWLTDREYAIWERTGLTTFEEHPDFDKLERRGFGQPASAAA